MLDKTDADVTVEDTSVLLTSDEDTVDVDTTAEEYFPCVVTTDELDTTGVDSTVTVEKTMVGLTIVGLT